MKKIMTTAHKIKRAAAVKWNCAEKEIVFGICLQMAHKGEGIKVEVAKTWNVNSKGFYMFESRNWSFSGDKNTWARLEDGKVQIHRGAKGTMSESYRAELNEFLAGYGTFLEDQYFGKTTTIN